MGKGGSMRSMLPMIGLSESAPEMKVLDAWLEKLNKCKSEQLTSATVCLSKNYKGKMCNLSLQFFKERINKKENDKKIEDICKIARRNPATCGPPCCNHFAKKRLDFRRCKNTYKKCMADHSKMLTECVLERTKCYAIVRTADVTKETV